MRMLREWLFSSCNPAYSVVLCRNRSAPSPEKCRAVCVTAGATAQSVRDLNPDAPASGEPFLSSNRSTTRSPGGRHGRYTDVNRPTAQQQRNTAILRYALSAISSRAITLIRETSSEASLRPGRNISCNVPSTRKRITRLFSNVSMWISEAPSLIASASMALISLMIGASSSLSSRSSVSGSSSARVKVLGGTEIFHQLASFGRVPLPDRIQPLFKFGLVDLPQRKGRVQPRCSSCKTESDNG